MLLKSHNFCPSYLTSGGLRLPSTSTCCHICRASFLLLFCRPLEGARRLIRDLDCPRLSLNHLTPSSFGLAYESATPRGLLLTTLAVVFERRDGDSTDDDDDDDDRSSSYEANERKKTFRIIFKLYKILLRHLATASRGLNGAANVQ